MKCIYVFMFFAFITVCHAQDSERFRIGVGDVGPEYDLANHKLYPVRGFEIVDSQLARTSIQDSIRYHYLTQKQFDLVRELGLNLISVLIDPESVRRDAIPSNRNPDGTE